MKQHELTREDQQCDHGFAFGTTCTESTCNSPDRLTADERAAVEEWRTEQAQRPLAGVGALFAIIDRLAPKPK